MQLKLPFIITPRLLPGLKIGNSFISFEILDETTSDNRDICRYYFDNGDYTFTEAELRSGCGGYRDLQEAIEAFCGFLSAAISSYHYNNDVYSSDPDDNCSLFPKDMLEYLSQFEHEIINLEMELQGNLGLIEE